MNEDEFWVMIEAAWSGADESGARALLLDDDQREEVAFELAEPMEQMMERLRETLDGMEQSRLLAFDRVMERLMYRIDRAEIQAVTDGSDDGFEYARAFVVACGRAYYALVDGDPSKAVCDAELDGFAWIAVSALEERFGESAWTRSDISRASCTNADGWPET